MRVIFVGSGLRLAVIKFRPGKPEISQRITTVSFVSAEYRLSYIYLQPDFVPFCAPHSG
jgi:hypothetical protein